jgi:small GTP-binding protein
MSRKKIMLFGEIGVGKTSLIRRFVLGKFEGTYRGTIGYDLYNYTVRGVGEAGDRDQDVVIWDTDGNFGANIFKNETYTRGTSAALIVGDLTRPETFGVMLEHVAAFTEKYPALPAMLVLNKADLAEEFGMVDVPAALTGTGFDVVKTSAKTGAHVEAAFVEAINAALRRGV